MKRRDRYLRIAVFSVVFLFLSLSLGTWVIHRHQEVATVGWSPLYETRMEQALAPLRGVAAMAQAAPTREETCKETCSTCQGPTCEATCENTCDCPVKTMEGYPTCEGMETCERTCEGIKTCDWTCGGSTCDWTCEGYTCRGETCDWTCMQSTCGGPTCDGWTCGETCQQTCDGWTCEETCRETCQQTCGGWTCEGSTCDGSTCDGSTCEWTCASGLTCFGLTCDATCEGPTCDSPTCEGETCFGPTCDAPTCFEITCTDRTCEGPTCSGFTCRGLTCAAPTCLGQTCLEEGCLVWDFGDAPNAPDDSSVLPLNYPTELADRGARHEVAPQYYLGSLIDAEHDGQPDLTATGDDRPFEWDDEDGVWFASSLVPGGRVILIADASRFGYLDGWIDFDGSGDWAEREERIFDPSAVLNVGFNWLGFDVPWEAVSATTYARFRFGSTGRLGTKGLAPDGEVEDYALRICFNFMVWIMTDSLYYHVGDNAAISFYVSDPATVSLISYKPDGSQRVLWTGTVEAGRHWFPRPGDRFTVRPPEGTETVGLRAMSLDSGCSTWVSTPFRVAQ